MPTAAERNAALSQMKGGDKMAERKQANPRLSGIDPTNIPEVTREGPALKTLKEFMDSGIQAALVEADTQSFGSSLKAAAKKSNLPVEVMSRGGAVYIRRTDGEAPEGE